MVQFARGNETSDDDTPSLFYHPGPEDMKNWEDVVIGEKSDSTDNQSTQKQSKLAVGVKQLFKR
jgi:hypothetical protein